MTDTPKRILSDETKRKNLERYKAWVTTHREKINTKAREKARRKAQETLEMKQRLEELLKMQSSLKP